LLHVRVVSPAELTSRLVTGLTSHPGVRNLVLLKGTAQRPDGDAVQFDLLNASANPVLHELRSLGLDSRGSVTVGEVSVALHGPPSPAAERRYARREQVPVWDLVEGTIRANASYPPSFYLLLIIAGLIAAVGILTNSQILIVGAMVVGPEYFAIIAIALGLSSVGSGERDWTAVRVSLAALCYGFLAAIVVTLLFGLAVRATGTAPQAFRNGVKPVAELINSPNVFSVIVAVLAGLVGVVSLTESRANALIGVFISITTIPAAASIGLSIAFANWHDAEGSVAQLLLNAVILIVVGAAGLSAQRVIWRRLADAAGPGGRPPGTVTGWRSD
jgi:uncharacterized hydrophobic protein (TIGR00271 family)